MHIATFYSFKGGVGRTQALVNVGVELAQRGRRALLVDFDLEAPGIDTYPLPRPKDAAPGLVEFVTEYMVSGEAPDAARHIYECPGVGQRKGRLWIMPSGNQDESYARRLSEIDWRALYSERGGYLLFEDLKVQWQQSLAPDYVLIDSRTGYSDVSGICTRQLPDSVVIVFFPTNQHLRGLPKVVEDIRAEANGPRQKHINLAFVMSNVPDLDDEDQILESRIALFADTLDYDELEGLVHRYDNLALLNQVIFTADRPKSRLAREYRALTDKLIEHNLNDREGALAFIERMMRRSDSADKMSRLDIESRLDLIRRTHESDPEIVQRLADLRMLEGRFEYAHTLWTQLVDMQVVSPHVLLRRGESRAMTGNRTGALIDIEAVLGMEDAADFEIARALSLLAALAPDRLRAVARAPAIRHLGYDRKFWVGLQLAREDDGLHAARDIFTDLLEDPSVPETQRTLVRRELAVTLVGLGQVDDGRKLLRESPTRETSVAESFNYAMASWACDGNPQQTLFERVLELDDDSGSGPSYAQCLAVTYAVLGRRDDAEGRLNQARQRLASRPEPTFSCWRYRIASPETFLDDLEAIRQFSAGEPVRPLFFDHAPTHS